MWLVDLWETAWKALGPVIFLIVGLGGYVLGQWWELRKYGV